MKCVIFFVLTLGVCGFVHGQAQAVIPDCSCLPPLQLEEGYRYIVNAWVKLPDAPAGTITYSGPMPNGPHPVRVEVSVGGSSFIALPVGYIIDGWQLMEGEFTVPVGDNTLELELTSEDVDAFFDDVRIFPAEGSLKSYVYDPASLRLCAELDERHFATLYEYDNEGRLVRVKKETERGRVTLRQTQYNTHHVEP